MLLCAVLGGFLAFKLYRLGLFLNFWLLGTAVFAIAFIFVGSARLLGLSVVLGLIVGVLALVLHKGFIIVTTAFSGGMMAGLFLAAILFPQDVEIAPLFGFILSALGVTVQFLIERKGPAVPKKEEVDATIQNDFPVNAAANHTDAGKKNASAAPGFDSQFVSLSVIQPDYYCPKSKIAFDSVSLLKDSTGNVHIQLGLRNLRDDEIIGVIFKVLGYDIADNLIGEQMYRIQDITIGPDETFRSDRLQLFDSSIRRTKIVISQLVGGSGAVENFEPDDTVPLPELTPVSGIVDKEIADLIGFKPDEKYLYAPLENGLWMCTCGHIASHTCSYCWRNAEQSLQNGDSSLAERVSDYLDALMCDAEKADTLKALTEYKDKIEKAQALLTQKNFDAAIVDKCKSPLEEIERRCSQLQQDAEKKKALTKKYLRIGAVCLGALIILGIGIKIMISLPPSRGKIKSAVASFISETYPGEYTVIKMDLERMDWTVRYSVVATVQARNKENKDIIETEVILYYVKEDGRYKFEAINERPDVVVGYYPGHKIGEKDSFEFPRLRLVFPSDAEDFSEENYSAVGPDNIDALIGSGLVSTSFEIDHAGIKVEDNIATVPATLSIETKNAKFSDTLELLYEYQGDYIWRYIQYGTDKYVNIRMEPDEGVLLDEAAAQRLISESSINYNNENLSGGYIHMDGSRLIYTDGYIGARLEGAITWDNSVVKLTGNASFEFAFLDGGWHLVDVQIDNVSDVVRYDPVTDEELINSLNRVIPDNCEQNQAVTDIRVIRREKIENGIAVWAEYHSEDGNFIVTNRIRAEFQETLLQGYQFSALTDEEIISASFREEMHETTTAGYQVHSSTTYPATISRDGYATMDLSIDSNNNATLSVTMGGFNLSFSGWIEYPSNHLNLGSFRKELFITHGSFLNVDISNNFDFDVYPDFYYEDHMIKGIINFDTQIALVDDFSMTFN